MVTVQDGDLVRLFPNIESLDARRWTQATLPEDSLEPEDAIGQKSRYEQLTALTRLTTLIMHRSAGWGALRMQVLCNTQFWDVCILADLSYSLDVQC